MGCTLECRPVRSGPQSASTHTPLPRLGGSRVGWSFSRSDWPPVYGIMRRMDLLDDERDFNLPPPEIPHEEFLAWRSPRCGATNPTDFSNPLWMWLVRSRLDAFNANERFKGPSPFDAGPMWCFHRYGTSRTTLPDGQVIHVAGEHEDYYDPDFHIYNDVILEHPDGTIKILGYPKEEFPPTDFHSATLAGDRLILIGNLGYPDDRRPGATPVLEIELHGFKARTVQTQGDGPGWISRHTAAYVQDTGQIMVQGGEIFTGADEPMLANVNEWALDVSTWTWTCRTRRDWLQLWFMREDRRRNHLWDLRHLAWYESVRWNKEELDAWRAKLASDLGFQPDTRGLDTLCKPWQEAEALPENEGEHGIHEVRIHGVLVRFDESDGFGVRVLVQGDLADERIEELRRGMLGTLRALEGVDWVVKVLAGRLAAGRSRD